MSGEQEALVRELSVRKSKWENFSTVSLRVSINVEEIGSGKIQECFWVPLGTSFSSQRGFLIFSLFGCTPIFGLKFESWERCCIPYFQV